MTDRQKDNYERLLLAVALYYSGVLDIDVTQVDSYSKLTEQQKMFAKKVVEQNPKIEKQLQRKGRLSEQTITKDIAKIAEEDEESGDLKKVITAGDQDVCEHCKRWQGKIISLSGKDRNYPSLDDFIRSHGLHYGCRCYLADIDIKEIPRKKPNPKAYNEVPKSMLVFN